MALPTGDAITGTVYAVLMNIYSSNPLNGVKFYAAFKCPVAVCSLSNVLTSFIPSMDTSAAAEYIPSMSLGCEPECKMWFNFGARARRIVLDDPVTLGSQIVVEPGFGFEVPHFTFWGLHGAASAKFEGLSLTDPRGNLEVHAELRGPWEPFTWLSVGSEEDYVSLVRTFAMQSISILLVAS